MTTLGRSIREIISADGQAARCVTATAAVEIRAADEAEGRKLPTFQIDAYTGEPMDQLWSERKIILDLAGLDVTAKSRPILREHSELRVIGHTDSVKVVGSSLRVSGTLSGVGADADEVRETSANGFPWQASVRASVLSVEQVEAGQKASVNGKTYEGPVTIVRKSRLKEVSFVALGADDNTSASVAARDHSTPPAHGGATMDFTAWAAERGHDLTAMNEEQIADLRAKYDAEVKASGSDDAGKDDTPPPAKPKAPAAPSRDVRAAESNDQDDLVRMRELRAAEVEREDAIRAIADANPKVRTVVAQAIREGWSKDRFELEALRKAGDGVTGIRSGGADVTASTLECALCITAGLAPADLEKHYDERTINAAMEGELQHAGLGTLVRASLRAAGRDVGIGGIGDAEIRAALEVSASGGFSTVNIPNVTSNVANKALLASFTAEESVATQICRETSNNDFKPSTRVRLTDTGALEPVNKAGKVAHGSVEDEGYTNKVSTVGKILTLTREDIINDDLGAFLQLPTLLGHRAFVSREKTVITELLAGITDGHFSSGNGNYIEGSGTALSSAALTQLRVLFRKMKDANNDFTMVMPRLLLTPEALADTAMELVTSEKVVGPTTSKSPDKNIHRGKYEVLSSPYIDADSGLTNATNTGFWLFANPASLAAIEIAYLRGRRVPIIETGATDMSTLGVNYRCIYDFGVALQDTRGAAFSKGAT